MLSDPDAWIMANYDIPLRNGRIWVADLTVEAPADGAPWLYESPYQGEGALMVQGVSFGGPDIALLIQTAVGDSAPGGVSPSDDTQAYLEIVTNRSETVWGSIRAKVLDVDLAGASEETSFFLNNTREAFGYEGVTFSAGSTRLLAIDLPLAIEYGAVTIGRMAENEFPNAEGFVMFGENCVIVYNGTF